jgi:hypothetical protein
VSSHHGILYPRNAKYAELKLPPPPCFNLMTTLPVPAGQPQPMLDSCDALQPMSMTMAIEGAIGPLLYCVVIGVTKADELFNNVSETCR